MWLGNGEGGEDYGGLAAGAAEGGERAVDVRVFALELLQEVQLLSLSQGEGRQARVFAVHRLWRWGAGSEFDFSAGDEEGSALVACWAAGAREGGEVGVWLSLGLGLGSGLGSDASGSSVIHGARDATSAAPRALAGLRGWRAWLTVSCGRRAWLATSRGRGAHVAAVRVGRGQPARFFVSIDDLRHGHTGSTTGTGVARRSGRAGNSGRTSGIGSGGGRSSSGSAESGSRALAAFLVAAVQVVKPGVRGVGVCDAAAYITCTAIEASGASAHEGGLLVYGPRTPSGSRAWSG